MDLKNILQVHTHMKKHTSAGNDIHIKKSDTEILAAQMHVTINLTSNVCAHAIKYYFPSDDTPNVA